VELHKYFGDLLQILWNDLWGENENDQTGFGYLKCLKIVGGISLRFQQHFFALDNLSHKNRSIVYHEKALKKIQNKDRR